MQNSWGMSARVTSMFFYAIKWSITCSTYCFHMVVPFLPYHWKASQPATGECEQITCSYWEHACHNYIIIVQPRLSEPLWPAPKSKHSDNRESIFNVRLTMPTPISYSIISQAYWTIQSFILYFWLRTTAHALHDLLERYFGSPVICMNIANDGCTALYCACTHWHHIMPDICTLTCTFAWLRSSDNWEFR